MTAPKLQPGHPVVHKHTGTRYNLLSVRNGYASVQTKPGLRIWVFPVSVLRAADQP